MSVAEFLDRAHPWAITLVYHNWPVMVYSLVAIYAAVQAYSYPSRHTVLFLYGALGLVLNYEYMKHGLPTVLDTTNYLFSLERSALARSMSQWLLLSVVPVVGQFLGFAALLVAILWRWRESRRIHHRQSAAMFEF